MANQWFKFYGGEFLSDTKIERLSAQERSCWLTILCLASIATEAGIVEFLTTETLLKKSGIDFDPYHPEEWEKSLGVLKKFEQMKMITMDDEGTVRILNWEKRQEHNLTVAERVAKSRANKKSNENVTINVTDVTTEENRIEESRVDIIQDIEPKQKKFVKPNYIEIVDYCLERKNNVNTKKFYDFYEAKGWKIGKNSMKDWKACVRTWENSQFSQYPQKPANVLSTGHSKTLADKMAENAAKNK